MDTPSRGQSREENPHARLVSQRPRHRTIVFFRKLEEQPGLKNHKKMRRFDVLRVATGSYTVEKKRIASRKLFKRVPGLQDAKNGPKRTEDIKNRQTSDFAGFLAVFFALFFQLGRRHGALARESAAVYIFMYSLAGVSGHSSFTESPFKVSSQPPFQGFCKETRYESLK